MSAIGTSPISILIVDDEKKACENIRSMLLEYVDASLNIVGAANSTAEAEVLIRRYRPNAVFLDIEMPNENAFQFLERLTTIDFEIIFATAYDEYAVRAFRLNALDYILKPISIAELKSAIERLKARIQLKELLKQERQAYTEIFGQINNNTLIHRITLRHSNGMDIVDFNDVLLIEAQGSYSKIVFLKLGTVKEVIMSNPLSDYEELLPANVFLRVHRSFLVNCSTIRKIENDDQAASLILIHGISVPVSRRRMALLIQFLEKNKISFN